MNQTELSEKTGYTQGDVSKLLKSIRTLSFVPPRIKKVLDALGWTIIILKKGEVVTDNY